METGTHFHLAKKIHALNSNRVEKKNIVLFYVCCPKKNFKNDMFRAFFTIPFEIFNFLLFFLFNIEMFIKTSDPWATLLSSLAQQ